MAKWTFSDLPFSKLLLVVEQGRRVPSSQSRVGTMAGVQERQAASLK